MARADRYLYEVKSAQRGDGAASAGGADGDGGVDGEDGGEYGDGDADGAAEECAASGVLLSST